MSTDLTDLNAFHQFASHELLRGHDKSLEALLRQWRERRHEEPDAETLASIRRGVADAEAGRLRDLDEVDASIRGQLGFPTRGR